MTSVEEADRLRLAQDIAEALEAATVEAQVSACVQRILRAGAGLLNTVVVLPGATSATRLGVLVSDARRRTSPPRTSPLETPARHQRPSRYPRRTR